MILGMVLVFIGVAMLSAPLIPGLTGILGWPGARFGGAAGALARDNARRNPQRTASTAAALMIGLALVTLVATLAGSVVQTFTGAVNEIFVGDYAITAQNNFSPIPIDAAEAAAQAPGVAGGRQRPHRRDARLRLDRVLDGSRSGRVQGDQARLGRGLGRGLRRAREGRRVRRQGLRREARPPGRLAGGDHLRERQRPRPSWSRGSSTRRPADRRSASSPSRPRPGTPRTTNPKNIYSFVLMDGGETDANAAALEAALKPFPNAKVATRQEFVDNQISGLKSILNILYVLLGALDHRQPLRDRQHARAQRLRAHA